MIKNDRDRAAARKKIACWDAMKRRNLGLARNYGLDASGIANLIDGEIQQLNDQLEHYHKCQLGRISPAEDDDFPQPFTVLRELSNVPRALIEARLVLGWTQTQLAEAAKNITSKDGAKPIQPKQICTYENGGYSQTSLLRVIELAQVLLDEANEREHLRQRKHLQ